MGRVLFQALMILQFRWEGGWTPNTHNADSSRGACRLWLRSGVHFNHFLKLILPWIYIQSMHMGLHETHLCCIFFCGWSRQFDLELEGCLFWISRIHLKSPICFGIWICINNYFFAHLYNLSLYFFIVVKSEWNDFFQFKNKMFIAMIKSCEKVVYHCEGLWI